VDGILRGKFMAKDKFLSSLESGEYSPLLLSARRRFSPHLSQSSLFQVSGSVQ